MSNKFITRWLFSTNCKDIAILYLIFAVFSGLIGTGLSLIIRLELAGPTPQILADNGQVYNVVISAHAIFMIFFLVMPMSVGFFGNFRFSKGNTLSYENNSFKFDCFSNEISKLDNNFLGPYLAGLIEGDGTIWVGEDQNIKIIPKISVAFKTDDIPLANYLCKLTGCGSVVKKKSGNYVLWVIQNFREVYLLLSLINGHMRTPKHDKVVKAILWYNDYISNINTKKDMPFKGWDGINVPRSLELIEGLVPLVILDKDNSDLGSNSWLSGFTDADGNFSLSLYKKKRVNAYFRIEIAQQYKLSSKDQNVILSIEEINRHESLYPIISAIAILFNTKVYSRNRVTNLSEKMYSSYIVTVHNRETLPLVINYFNKYPLLSSKYLDFQDWSKVVNLILKKGQNMETYKIAEDIRKNYNKTRHTFNWDHLK